MVFVFLTADTYKSKGVPGYKYTGQHRGWQHGVDIGKFRHYGRLAERASVNIVVRELRSPPSLDLLPERYPPSVGGRPDWEDYHKHLVDKEVWRWISYEDCLRFGREEETWQRGGWLWPVKKMHVLTMGAHAKGKAP